MPTRLFTAAVLLCVLGCGDADSSSTPSVGGDGGGSGQPDGGSARPCEADADCDDGVYCNGLERCTRGACADGPAVDCDDGIECTIDSCSEMQERCRNEPPDEDDDGHSDRACLDDTGEPLGDDCDDADPDRFEGNAEVCDALGHDEDCDPDTLGGSNDADVDDDGFVSTQCCNEQAGGDLLCGDDCDDRKMGVNPGTPESCNGEDDDCDEVVDEGVMSVCHWDGDGDSYALADAATMTLCGVCPNSWTERDPAMAGAADCDDGDPARSPGENEVCNDIDDDCDGLLDAVGEDLDGDGHAGADCGGGDCQPTNPDVYPDAPELCDLLDNDCQGGPVVGEDDDGDGFAATDSTCAGGPFPKTDCDDGEAKIAPGAAEKDSATACMRDLDDDGYGDSVTSGDVVAGTDCDDSQAWTNLSAAPMDNPDRSSCMRDQDGDGYGDASATGLVAPGTDCDDALATAFPGVAASEGSLACMLDADGDGYGDANANAPYAAGTDCDDSRAAAHPGAAELDSTTLCTLDADGDSYGELVPTGPWQAGTDCDDSLMSVSPDGSDDTCDGVDQDCSGEADDGVPVCRALAVTAPSVGASDVGIDGDLVVAGTPSGAGAVEVRQRSGDTWPQLDVITRAGTTGLGRRVDIAGDTVVATQDFAVEVFRRNGNSWVHETSLPTTSRFPSVAIDGSVLVVGDYDAIDSMGQPRGVVRIYRDAAGWALEQTVDSGGAVVAPTAGDCDNNHVQFGRGVAVSGDLVAAGSACDSTAGEEAGSAFVFARVATVWTLERKLLPPAGSTFEFIGDHVALSGDVLLTRDVGEKMAARRRNGGTWSMEPVMLDPPTSGTWRPFAIDGDRILVVVDAAPDIRVLEPSDCSGPCWLQTHTVRGPGTDEAYQVAISGNVGAAVAYDMGPPNPRAYVFTD